MDKTYPINLYGQFSISKRAAEMISQCGKPLGLEHFDGETIKTVGQLRSVLPNSRFECWELPGPEGSIKAIIGFEQIFPDNPDRPVEARRALAEDSTGRRMAEREFQAELAKVLILARQTRRRELISQGRSFGGVMTGLILVLPTMVALAFLSQAQNVGWALGALSIVGTAFIVVASMLGAYAFEYLTRAWRLGRDPQLLVLN